MTAKHKNILLKNIEIIGGKTGKSIRGKGIEIFESDNECFVMSWSSGIEDGSFLEKLKMKISDVNQSRLFVKGFFEKNGRGYLKGNQLPSIDDILNGDALSRCSEIYIGLRGVKLYGYLPLTKYDATDIESMYQLVKDINSLKGYETCDEVLGYYDSEIDGTITFSDSGQWNGEYFHIHGGLCAFESKNSAIKDQDWKLDNYNQEINEDFWNIDFEYLKDYLKKEIDPEEQIAVYSYKGKKGHFGYGLETEEHELVILDEDGEEHYECAFFTYYKENPELLKEVMDIFASHLVDVEVKGCIYNNLGIDSELNNPRGDSIFNLHLIDTVYEDRNEFISILLDCVDYDGVDILSKSYEEAVKKAYELWLEKNVIGKADNGRYEEFSKLVSDTGYEISKSVVENTEYELFCVTYKKEEYHFFLAAMLDAKSAESFFETIRNALAKRLIMKLDQTVLIQKAGNVFVGFEDSIESGNCESGTMIFCQRHNIDTQVIGGIRGDVILGMEFSNYTRRAVMQAIAKHGDVAC